MLASPVYAASAGGQIVDNVTSYIEDDVTKIKFEFTTPLHYQQHFPEEFSEVILISLQPLRKGSEITTNIREHVRVPDNLTSLIDEMYIDGTENSNIFLVIHSKYRIKPEVKQDRKSKGIILSIDNKQQQNPANIECGDKQTGESSRNE